MSRIRVIATFPKIPDGNLVKFKEAAAQALELTSNEAGTLQYDCFLNEKEAACVVHEEYADSTSVLAHVAHLGPVFYTLLEVGGGCKFAVLGEPTSELIEATAALDVSVFPSHFQGK
jgi:quinol monooxygenase YgiN